MVPSPTGSILSDTKDHHPNSAVSPTFGTTHFPYVINKIDIPDSKNAWKRLRNSDCILWISIGNSYCDGPRLKAVIKRLNKAKVASCTIGLADALFRRTFGITVKMADFATLHRLALQQGDLWLS